MADVNIDLEAIEKELAGLTMEEIREQLVSIKAKQAINTAKYYNPETAKKARQKRSALIAAMTERAKKEGVYDQIVAAAREKADAELGRGEADSAA